MGLVAIMEELPERPLATFTPTSRSDSLAPAAQATAADELQLEAQRQELVMQSRKEALEARRAATLKAQADMEAARVARAVRRVAAMIPH